MSALMNNIFSAQSCRVASALAVFFFPSAIQAQTDTSDRAMLVLDASGSMWGQIDATPKMSIARAAVADMLADWDTDRDLGLIAYGHNREGDCSDIELLLPAEPLDADAFIDVVNGLNPRGKTPLTDAVVMAAETLGYAQAKATIILLTDGLETCERDPCAVATMLEERGIDFTAHVIGFDVAQEDAAALACLADNTGGLYLPADDMPALSEALQEVSEAVIIDDAVASSQEALDLGPATISVPDFVVVGHHVDVEWTGPQNAGDRIMIRDAMGTSVGGRPLAADDFTSPMQILAPVTVGTYDVFYEVPGHDAPLASAVLNVVLVAPSVTVPQQVPFGAAFAVEWTGPGTTGDRLYVVNPANEDQLSMAPVRADGESAGTATLTAPEAIGVFEVRLVAARTGALRASAQFETTAVIGSVRLPDGPFHVGDSAMQVAWSGPMNAGDRLRVFPRDSTQSISQRPVFGTAQSPIRVALPRDAGAYTIKLISADGTVYAEQDFDVLPDQ